MKMFRGDLEPALRVRLTENNLPIPLESAALVRVIGRQNRTVVFSREATAAEDGVVTMAWRPGDTDRVGPMDIEVEVVWPGTRPQTVRADEPILIAADYG